MQIQTLNQEDVQRIHDATLDVLENTGIWFPGSPEAMEVFKKNGCKVEEPRVRLPKKLVEESLACLPDRNTLRFCRGGLGFADEIGLKKGESHFGLIGNAYYIYDFEKGCHRDCLETDLDDKFLILDSLPNFEYDCCNLVSHSEQLSNSRIVENYDTADSCIEFIQRRVRDRAKLSSQKLPLHQLNRSGEEGRLEVLSHAILRGPEATAELLGKYGVGFVWCNPLSPLQYQPGETNGIIHTSRNSNSRRYIMISPEIMIGGTGPVTFAGSLVQHNAEILAGAVLAQLVNPGTPVIYGCCTAAMDLRNGEISQGNFETGLFNAASVQMADHYGMPSRISAGNTSAREPGVKAAVEAAMGLYLGKAAGGNLITTGLLDSTLMISYEHLFLMDEMINQIKSITGGIKMDAESLALDVIQGQGAPPFDYLGCDHTAKFMTRDVYYSDFCGRIEKSYEPWYDKAHNRVKEILNREKTDAPIDKEIMERFAAVKARLKEDNETWRTGRGDWWRSYVQDFR